MPAKEIIGISTLLKDLYMSYPFGMQMPGRVMASGSYRYGFQGQEKDDEVAGTGNSYTTHYRQYAPRLGRWKNLDPQAQKYPDLSPYNYAANNPLLFIDVQGDTIVLAGTTAQQKVTLAHLQKLTNDKLALKGNMVVITKLGGENPSKNLKAGTSLIRNLNKKGQPDAKLVTIDYQNSQGNFRTNTGNMAKAKNYTDAANGTGSNGIVSFDPSSNPSIPTVDPATGNVSGKTRPDEIGLSHELIHAKHYMDGDYSPRFQAASYAYKDASGTIRTQTTRKEELRTIGVAGNKKGDITENKIRKEQGLNPRGKY